MVENKYFWQSVEQVWIVAEVWSRTKLHYTQSLRLGGDHLKTSKFLNVPQFLKLPSKPVNPVSLKIG